MIFWGPVMRVNFCMLIAAGHTKKVTDNMWLAQGKVSSLVFLQSQATLIRVPFHMIAHKWVGTR